MLCMESVLLGKNVRIVGFSAKINNLSLFLIGMLL